MILSNNLYYYQAKLIRVIDGDTAWFTLDLGFKTYVDKSVRFNRINAPELRGDSKVAGLKAKEFVEQQFLSTSHIILSSEKVDSFGRAIAEIWLQNDDNNNSNSYTNLNDLIVQANHAVYQEY